MLNDRTSLIVKFHIHGHPSVKFRRNQILVGISTYGVVITKMKSMATAAFHYLRVFITINRCPSLFFQRGGFEVIGVRQAASGKNGQVHINVVAACTCIKVVSLRASVHTHGTRLGTVERDAGYESVDWKKSCGVI